jgi:hypothetical protein
MKKIIVSLILLIAANVSLTGCAGLKLNLVDASVQEPSNIAVYFTVDTRKGEPVPGVTADKFNIYEDGKLISIYESQQTILNPEVATVRYTLLLLDMSGSVVDSGQVPVIQEAVGAFLDNLGKDEKVAIYAFDGREEIQPIAEFGAREGQLSGRNKRLGSWKTKDPSTNLNGAIIEAVKVINEARESSDVPLRFGNLVIFTDGTDRAARATSSDALAAMKNAQIDAFVIGLGGEVDQEEMKRLGKNGFVHAGNKEAVVDAFAEVAVKIKALAARFYLLSYCSPARAGVHRLTVEAVVGDDKGKLDYQFDAEGFEPDCDPNDPPAFDVPGKRNQGKKNNRKGAKGNNSPAEIPPPGY